MQDLYIIVGVTRDGAIGRGGDLIVHSRADMRYFKETTMGHPVIMGRKTFESLPKGALPGRRNIIITGNHGYRAEGAEVVHSLEEAVALTAGGGVVPFIIGGAQVYAEALPRATRLYVTEFDTEAPDADAHFPAIDPGRWRKISEIPGEGLVFAVYELR